MAGSEKSATPIPTRRFRALRCCAPLRARAIVRWPSRSSSARRWAAAICQLSRRARAHSGLSHLPISRHWRCAVGSNHDTYAGGSYRSVTASPISTTPLWAGLLTDNAEYLVESIGKFRAQLDALEQRSDRGTRLHEALPASFRRGFHETDRRQKHHRVYNISGTGLLGSILQRWQRHSRKTALITDDRWACCTESAQSGFEDSNKQCCIAAARRGPKHRGSGSCSASCAAPATARTWSLRWAAASWRPRRFRGRELPARRRYVQIPTTLWRRSTAA